MRLNTIDVGNISDQGGYTQTRVLSYHRSSDLWDTSLHYVKNRKDAFESKVFFLRPILSEFCKKLGQVKGPLLSLLSKIVN